MISGSVTDKSTQEPLPGVGVVVDGTTKGTVTDIDGNFSFQVSQGQTINVSFLGYVTQQIVVDEKDIYNVKLSIDTKDLDEVVIIGYGQVKKSDATGSVIAVGADDFNQGAITSAQDLIVGKTPGVVITSSGGAPGSGSQIRIRGGSSLKATNDPLIIVDGMPLDDDVIDGSANALSMVNPNDIESFTVLKDASATAIYGSRASNGVIIITTKKGKAGSSLRVSYNGNVSISSATGFVDVYSGDEMRKIAYDKKDLFDPLTYDRLGKYNTDWQKEIFQTAISHDHNLSLTGSLKSLPYRVSLGYTNQDGILINTGMERFTGSVSLNPTFLDDALKVNVNAKLMHTLNNFGEDKAIASAIDMDPTQPIFDGNPASAGYFQWSNYGAGLGTPNPVEQALFADNNSIVNRFVGNVQLDYTIPFIPNVRLNLNVATDRIESDGHNNRPVTSPQVIINPLDNGKLSDFTGDNRNDLLDFYANFSNDYNRHHVDFMAGYSWQYFKRQGTTYTRSIPREGHDLIVSEIKDWKTHNQLVSFFGRLNYGFDDRIMLTGTVRYDGSSRFHKDNRWGLFPSAGLAWKLKNESFLKDVDVVSDLKLRLGWGITGQQEIGEDFPAQANYDLSEKGSYYMIDGRYLPTLRPLSYDPFIKWEETTTYNVGLDYSFADNRISGSIDAYKRVTDDLLNEITNASGANFSNRIYTNVGSLENQGIEFNVNLRAISQKDISLEFGFNATYNHQEVTKLISTDDPEFIGLLDGSTTGGTRQVTRVGEEAKSFFMHKQVYNTNGNPIEGVYEDLSGNGGVVSASNENRYIYHNPSPDYIFGGSIRFNYKKFDFATSLRANVGNYVYNQLGAYASFDQMQQIGYWKNMPKFLESSQFTKRQFSSDYWVSNASFLKMDNISAGYRFDNFSNSGLNARLSFTVQNVFTITKYEGVDPEIEDGLDDNFYPRPRSFVLGLNLTF